MSSPRNNNLKSWEKQLSELGALTTMAIDDCEKAKLANTLAEIRLQEIGRKIEALYVDLDNKNETP